MIATGTDVRPLEVLIFMRDVKSRVYFEQMKGRGTRVISPTDFQSVTPNAVKDRFVIVDCVGVTEREEWKDSPSLDRRDRETRKVRWEKLDGDLVYSAGQLDRGKNGILPFQDLLGIAEEDVGHSAPLRGERMVPVFFPVFSLTVTSTPNLESSVSFVGIIIRQLAIRNEGGPPGSGSG
jgi:superfamily II DNA or RNA helicase